MRTLLFTIAVFLLTFSTAAAKPLSLDQIHESVCKVSRRGALGSGAVIAQDNTHYYIMTNAHVVGSDKTVGVRFYSNGVESKVFTGPVTWKVYSESSSSDIAVIKLSKSSLGSWPAPRVIELAPKGYKVKENDRIRAVGFPEGGWASGWIGRVRAHEGNTVSFFPAPKDGQSGTCVTVEVPDETGELHTRVAILLAWRVDKKYGAGVSLEQIYSALSGEVKRDSIPTNYKRVDNSKWEAVPRHEHKVHKVGKHNKRCPGCGFLRSQHNYYSDGKYYCPNHTQPKGIQRQPNPTCPDGNCPLNPFRLIPRPRPNPGAGNHGEPPPISGSKPKPTPPAVCPECEKLKAELKALRVEMAKAEAKFKVAEKKLLALDGTFKELQGKHKDVLGKYDSLDEAYEAYKLNADKKLGGVQGELKDMLDKYGDAKRAAEGFKSDAEQLAEMVGDAESKNADLIAAHKEEVSEQKSWTNIWGGATGGLGLLGMLGLGWAGYKRYKKDGIGGVVDGAKDRIIDKITGGGDDEPDPEPPYVEPEPEPQQPHECNGYIMELENRLSVCEEHNLSLVSEINQYRHQDWNEPPPPLYPKRPFGDRVEQEPAPVAETGLGPVHPNMPGRMYSAEEVLNAVDEVGRRHRDDLSLGQVPTLVRQVLETPKRVRPPLRRREDYA